MNKSYDVCFAGGFFLVNLSDEISSLALQQGQVRLGEMLQQENHFAKPTIFLPITSYTREGNTGTKEKEWRRKQVKEPILTLYCLFDHTQNK